VVSDPDDPRDDESGSLHGRIRPYAITGGRTRPVTDFPVEALIRRTAHGLSSLPRLAQERRRIVELAASPLSIAEVSADLGVHLGVVRVLVADLDAEGMLTVQLGRPAGSRPDIAMLERVLDGLKAL
jgi:hypothetical protein